MKTYIVWAPIVRAKPLLEMSLGRYYIKDPNTEEEFEVTRTISTYLLSTEDKALAVKLSELYGRVGVNHTFVEN